MNYPIILRHFGRFGFFELTNLLAFTNAKPATGRKTIHRWIKGGLIIPLRRGFYAFPEDLAKNPITAETAANQIYKPSYITGLWRLNQLGLIPEGVTEITSATLNNPARFDTPLGRFVYQHLNPTGFFGYETATDGPVPVRLATPEKALLDLFWWKPLDWNHLEFARWRIQDPFHKLNLTRLDSFAKRWGHPRLVRAAQNLRTYLNG